ncbi:MAG: PepSY domain-containing protein [Campylobacteraceae bacterium]|nr:PepSY domain-containing protein [Campylobacteraceae bacterium]
MLRIFKKSWWFNIHMILGLLLGITIMIVGVTGALLSYRPEIMALINSDSLYVKKSADTPLSLAQIVKKISEQKSNVSISSLTVYSDETRSVTAGTMGGGHGRGGIYVDPYTGKILPDMKGGEFFNVVISLHRWMTFQGMNATGKQVVAISTIAIIILSISGLWLYLPPMRRNFLKSMAINFKRGWFALLYKLHIVIGIYTLIFVLIMCLTGLYWSYGWYRTMLYKIAGVEQPVRMQMQQRQQPRVDKVDDISYLDTIYTVFNDKIGEEYTSLTLSTVGQNGTYSVSYQNIEGDMNRAQVNIEKNEIIINNRTANRTLGEKFMSSIYPLHSGYFFGEIGKFIWCISSAAMALFMISGFVMFYKRIKARYRFGK